MFNKQIERRDFLKLVLGGASAAALETFPFPAVKAGPQSHPKHVVILGIDGMDPKLTRKFIGKGRLPTIRKLMEEGSFRPLKTSIPPQSPVAWSNFITGMDPGGHGIFDFIHRDPETYLPTFSASRVEEPSRVVNIGDWCIPLSKGKVLNLRRGRAFWEPLSANGVPCTIFSIPSNFPPVACEANTVSGLGTPDILGTYGTFSFFTDDPAFFDLDVSGGKIYPITVKNHRVDGALTGPENTLKKDRPDLTSPFTVHIDTGNELAKIVLGGDELLLKKGEWSRWVEVPFPIIKPFYSVNGICRFYLKSLEPHFSLYVSPVNIDPANPALPISTPDDYSKELAEKAGHFYTQGMAEETKGLEWGVLTDAEFIDQARIVLEERRKILDVILDDYNGGLMFFYFSTLDLCQHMLWRNMDAAHPGHTDESEAFKDMIETLYNDMDGVVAHVLSRIPEDATLMVMSDHGFSPFYRKFNLNTWLYKNGFLELRNPERMEEHRLFNHVSWRRTKAYGLGINGLYVNLRGREKSGVVRQGREYDELIQELSQKLLRESDPETGEPVISHVYHSREYYHGPEAESAPDLIIGYNRGYRNSDESAIGNFTKEVLLDNMSKWSGDHCMSPEHIPGIFVANRRTPIEDPSLMDFAATVLALFGMEEEAPSSSRALFKVSA